MSKSPPAEYQKSLWLIEIMCAIVPKASALGSDPLCDAIRKKNDGRLMALPWQVSNLRICARM